VPVIILSADDRAAEMVPSFEDVTFLSKGSSGALKVLTEIRARADVAPKPRKRTQAG
jgi:hypothetical protein